MNNIASVLPNLQLDSDVIQDIQNAVNTGKEVTVSKSNISFGGWTGVGYIVFDPTTGDGGYRISGGKNGGFLTVLGTHWMDVGAILYDEDPFYGMEVMMSGINLINQAQTLWMDVLKEAGGVAAGLAMDFVPWGKVAGSLHFALGCVAGSIKTNRVLGLIFQKITLSVINLSENTKKIATNLGNIIPDGYVGNLATKTEDLWEVKSGLVVCKTGNLSKMIDYAMASEGKVRVNLIVKKGVHLTKTIKDLVPLTGGKIYYFDVITKTIDPPMLF